MRSAGLLFIFSDFIFSVRYINPFVQGRVIAGVAVGAGGAIIRAAGALHRGEFLAGVGVGEGVDAKHRDDVIFALDILRADLEGVEQKAGCAGVDAAGAEGIEDLSEGDLDGAAVFKDGKPEVIHHSDGRLGGEAVKARVEVAIRLAFEGRRVAIGSVGHDVATFV